MTRGSNNYCNTTLIKCEEVIYFNTFQYPTHKRSIQIMREGGQELVWKVRLTWQRSPPYCSITGRVRESLLSSSLRNLLIYIICIKIM
jgi:hypothetical protein